MLFTIRKCKACCAAFQPLQPFCPTNSLNAGISLVDSDVFPYLFFHVDLQALPSNSLEALKSECKGQYSIRINMQWRICFEWPARQSGPSNTEIVDQRCCRGKQHPVARADGLQPQGDRQMGLPNTGWA